jgi:hypothetical protein
MSDHIPDATKMVPDGYYTALVQGDTGGEISTHVRVLDGIPRNARGATLRRDACRDFMPVCVEDFCRAWPWDAAMELSALRTGNAALVERVKRIEAAANKLAQRHLLVPTTYPQAQAHVAEYHRAKATP